MHYQYHIVDNTPPHVIILKPTDGWYAPGSVIPSVVVAEDLMSPHSECCMGSDCAVGIQHGSPGKAWLIDIFPEFKIIELETENFLYDAASHEYIGNVKIPIDANITDGSCLFVVGSEDRLGNNWTSIHELVHAYIIQALAECGPYENCVMGFLADVLVDFIADRNIVFVGIDGTPPEVEFDESESTGAPIPDVLYPGVLEIKANITDTLTGIKSGSTCYIYLNGIMLEQLPYDQFTETCHGWIGIPNYYPNMEDVPLTIEAYDDVGNKGSDTVIVDYVNTMSNVIPIIRFESPDWNTTHSGILSIEVSAHDDTTPTEDLIVKIKVDREDDPPFIYFASYNSGTGTFFCHLDISEYQNGTKLVVQAFAVDKDGYSGDTEPRQFWVESNIIYDQWMHYGWNLVNIVELCGDGIQDIADVLDCLGDNYDWVFEVGSWDNWYRYRTIQSLTTIEEGKWYWINITTWQGIRFYLEDCIIEEPPIPENHAPIANDDTYQTKFDVTFDTKDAFFGVLKNDTDPDGDSMTVQLVSDVMYGTLTLSVNGSFIYVPGPDFYGDSFTYQVYDEHGLAGNIATVTINMCIECIDQGEPS
jgi:Big-like domain-containing protein